MGPILFTIYINNLGDGISQTHFHFYADDTAIYCEAATLHQAFSYLQSAFNLVQIQLYQLKLVLNVEKTKIMLYSKSKKSLDSFPSIFTIHGEQIEQVKLYKYLGILIDDQLSFKLHIDKLVKKLKLKIGFYFRNKACFSWKTRRRLVAATFLPALDYGDLLYRNAPDKCLSLLDTVYHNALRFVTGCKASVHHCTLYKLTNWPSLSVRRHIHWLIFIYKSMLDMLPSYLCSYMSRNVSSYNLRSGNLYLLSVPTVRTELGKKAFSYAARPLGIHYSLNYNCEL